MSYYCTLCFSLNPTKYAALICTCYNAYFCSDCYELIKKDKISCRLYCVNEFGVCSVNCAIDELVKCSQYGNLNKFNFSENLINHQYKCIFEAQSPFYLHFLNIHFISDISKEVISYMA